MSLHFTDFLNKNGRNVIAIDGHGGSGKSTLATYLATTHRATIIALDDFTGWQPKATWAEDFVTNILTPLTTERISTLSYQPVSWWPDHQPHVVTHTFIGNLIIIDGVRSCQTLFRPYLTCGILVESDTNLCLMRGVERDTRDGYHKGDVMRLWRQNLEQEALYLRNTDIATYASIILDGSKPYEGQIE
jgi:uridine kinase